MSQPGRAVLFAIDKGQGRQRRILILLTEAPSVG